MKLKKVIQALIIGSSLFTFSSCDLLFGILGGMSNTYVEEDTELETKTASDLNLKNSNENVFFVQMNNSNKEFSNRQVGYIAKKSNTTRALEEELEIDNIYSNVTKAVNIDKYHAQVQKLNTAGNIILSNSEDRAAENKIDTKVRNIERKLNESYKYYFVVQDDDENQSFVESKAVCKANGKYCNVLYIKNTDLVSDSDLDFSKVAENFDMIYEKETSIVGSNIYKSKLYSNIIDPMSKIDVVVADIMDKATKDQEGGVYGYFYSNDFFINGEYYYFDANGEKQTYEVKYSNETQSIYVDSYFLKNKPEQVYSTLVHEFNHLLNYCQKNCVYGLNNTSSWYTEMLSMVMEDLFQHYLNLKDEDSAKNRLGTFNCSSYAGFENWKSGEDVYRSYANAFGFGSYLVRNFGGVELLKEIATNEYIDEESITKALKKLNYNFDYNKALRYFPLVFINVDTNGNDSKYADYFTLNRAVKYDKDETLYFDALNLNDYKWILMQADKTTKEVFGPFCLDVGMVFDLDPSGFFINKVCEKNKFKPENYKVMYVKPDLVSDYYTYFVNYDKIYN